MFSEDRTLKTTKDSQGGGNLLQTMLNCEEYQKSIAKMVEIVFLSSKSDIGRR